MHLAPRTLGWLLLGPALAGCAASPSVRDDFRVREVTPPALATAEARTPAIAADGNGRAALLFVTGAAGAQDVWLALSSDSGLTFSDPVRVNPRAGTAIASSENRPAAAYGPGAAFAIAWNERDPDDPQASNIVVRASGDGGRTLGRPTVVHEGLGVRHHMMPAVVFRPDGALMVAWIGAHSRGIEGGGDLFYATSLEGGRTWTTERGIRNVCPCGGPAALSDAYGRVAIAYRTDADGVHDPAIAVSDENAMFVVDEVVSPDGWRAPDCRGLGSAISWSREDGGQYAWFSAAGDTGVFIAPWSADRGAMGLRRAVGDSLAFSIRPRLAVWSDATLLAVEGTPQGEPVRTVLAVRRLSPAGNFTPWTFLGGDIEEPWLAAAGEHAALACWIERDRNRRTLRLVRLTPA
jgi:hypothetical protein